MSCILCPHNTNVDSLFYILRTPLPPHWILNGLRVSGMTLIAVCPADDLLACCCLNCAGCDASSIGLVPTIQPPNQIASSPKACQSPKDSGFHSHENNSFYYASTDNSRADLHRGSHCSRGSHGSRSSVGNEDATLRPPSQRTRGRADSVPSKDGEFELQPRSEQSPKQIIVSGVTVMSSSADGPDDTVTTATNGGAGYEGVFTYNKKTLPPLANDATAANGDTPRQQQPSVLPPIGKANGWTNPQSETTTTNLQPLNQSQSDTNIKSCNKSNPSESESVLLSYDNSCNSTTPLVISPTSAEFCYNSELGPSSDPSPTSAPQGHQPNGPKKSLTPDDPISEEPPKEDPATQAIEEVIGYLVACSTRITISFSWT